MGKVIGYPLTIVAVPQVCFGGLYLMLRAALGESDALKIGYAVAAGLSMLITLIFALSELFETQLPKYEKEQAALREK